MTVTHLHMHRDADFSPLPPEYTLPMHGDVVVSPPRSRLSRCLSYVNPFEWQSLMGWPLLATYFIITFAQVNSDQIS